MVKYRFVKSNKYKIVDSLLGKYLSSNYFSKYLINKLKQIMLYRLDLLNQHEKVFILSIDYIYLLRWQALPWTIVAIHNFLHLSYMIAVLEFFHPFIWIRLSC